jgi:hypothetical protein
MAKRNYVGRFDFLDLQYGTWQLYAVLYGNIVYSHYKQAIRSTTFKTRLLLAKVLCPVLISEAQGIETLLLYYTDA